MRVNALYLAQDTSCVDSRADFSVLPHTDGNRDVNADTPSLAEEVQSNPFGYRPFPLAAGVHLHWSLPKAFTKSMIRPILDYGAAYAKGKTSTDIQQLISAGWIREINPRLASVIISQPALKQAIAADLPESLRTAITGIEGLLLSRDDHSPPMPDRWTVTRFHNGTIQKSWLVSSDYLYPPGEGNATLGISYPIRNPEPGTPPFRFMGKAIPSEEVGFRTPSRAELAVDHRNAQTDQEYISANGYGDFAFAAFYPSCFSVLGFHDDDPVVIADPSGYSYEVMGCYADFLLDPIPFYSDDYQLRNPTADILQRLYQFCQDFSAFPEIILPEDDDEQRNFTVAERTLLLAAGWLDDDNRLLFPAIDPSQSLETTKIVLDVIRAKIVQKLDRHFELPHQTACYGKILIETKPDPPQPLEVGPDIAVGNTGTEALSAHLSNKVSDTYATAIEEHLEALQFFSRMDHLHTDIVARLRAFRHEKQFQAQSGGKRWMFRPRTEGKSEAAPTTAVEQITLPDHFAHLLNQLNLSQKRADHLDRAIVAQRKQLYSDWNKYLASRYVPIESIGDYPDINQARYFLEQAGVAKLEALEQQRPEVQQQLAASTAELRQAAAELQFVELADIADLDEQWSDMLRADQVLQDELLLNDHEEELVVRTLNTLIRRKNLVDQYGFPVGQVPEEAQKIMDQRAAYNATVTGGDDRFFDRSPDYLRLNRLLLEVWLPSLRRRPGYEMYYYPDHRFWTPKDPVVLFSGDGLMSRPEYVGRPEAWHVPGYLPCQIRVVSTWIRSFNQYPFSLRDAYDIDASPVSMLYDAVRYPLLLDWQVEYFATKGEKPGGTADGYLPDYLQRNYQLVENEIGLTPRLPPEASTPFFSNTAHNYWGNTILSAHSGDAMRAKLKTFLLSRLEGIDLAPFYATHSVPLVEQEIEQVLATHRHVFIGWFFSTMFPGYDAESLGANWHQQPQRLDDFLDWAFDNIERENAENQAQEANFHLGLSLLLYDLLRETTYLSQSLGGFTRGLLMETKGLQLPIEDPLSFPRDQVFAKLIYDLVGSDRHHSVLPRNPFNPIRAGALDIVRLRMVDYFGLELFHLSDVEDHEIVVAESLQTPSRYAGNYHLVLPPRLAQPARLNFRWLSALDDDVELNDHPATSPICGWVLVNELETSVAVYDQKGEALGTVDSGGHWRVFPGHNGPVDPAGISHPQLRRFVFWAINQSIESLVSQLNIALDKIEPDTYEQHTSQALLMSRPLALVRASLQLETKGHVAIHHGWNEFRKDIYDLSNGNPLRRDTHGVEHLEVAIRLGEDGQLNDGLVGFFIDDETTSSGFQNDQMSSPARMGNLFTIEDINLDLANGIGTEVRLSLLMDPRGKLHATTGLLPVQRLEVPVDQYREALKGIQVSFLTAPLLTPDTYLHLSLPPEPGFTWSWIEKRRNHWSERSTDGVLRLEEVTATFGDLSLGYWSQLLELGWLTAIGENRAHIVPPDRRPPLESAETEAVPPELEAFLAQHFVGDFQQNVAFEGKPTLREGWLKLSPTVAPPDE